MVRRKEIVIPAFKSEREEAEWWDAHPEVFEQMFDAASKAGTLEWVPPAKAEPTKLVSMRYPESEIARAQKLAKIRGVGYQTYIKQLLKTAMDREEAALRRQR
jgi:predicted DNA binding CopG/RHH family protein